MADLRPQYSEEVVGHGHPTKADVANRAWNVEHAEDGTHKILPGKSGIIMLFGQSAAPTGWTRKADWQNNAMLCYAATGAIGNGGAVNPQSIHAHGLGTLAGPNHAHGLGTLAGPSHGHGAGTLQFQTGDYKLAQDAFYVYDVGGGNMGSWIETDSFGAGAQPALHFGMAGDANAYTKGGAGSTAADGTGAITGAMAADGTGAVTGALANNTAPFYQTVIAATKD